MKHFNHNLRNKSSGKTVVIALVLVLLLAVLSGVFYGTYQRQHDTASDLKQQITQLNAQLSELQKKNVKPTQNNNATDVYTSNKGIDVRVYVPSKDAKLTSPVAIIGQVPGNWSFEASFPAIIKNAKGDIVAQAPAQVLGNWMTDKLVPFSAKLTFTSPASGDGILILQKDNPSGLAKNDDSVTIPIKF